MARFDRRCMVCGKRTDNAICWDCHAARSVPCTECGQPIPTITRSGTPARRATCVACTARLTADVRRTGVICKVCGNKYQDSNHDYQVCPQCRAISVPCPVCEQPMPKYRKRGKLRQTCSNKCRAVLHPPSQETISKMHQGQKAYYDRVGRTSHQNDLARGTNEYKAWRTAVFERDSYTCQDCGAHNHKGNGKTIRLHPHHIKPFATHPILRYAVSNGVTLCPNCHRKRHKHTFIGRAHKRDSRQLSLPIVES